MKLYKNPHLICENIDSDYYVCVNPMTRNGIKVITHTQKEILDFFDKEIDLKELANKTGYDEEDLEEYAKILSQKNIVNFSGNFDHDDWKTDPNNLNLWVHTTDKCNLRCSYCYINTKETHKDMDEETMNLLIENILKTTEKHSLKKVTLRLSGGEPTIVLDKRMHKLNSLKEDLDNLGCELGLAFLTNGTIIKEKQMDYLKDNKVGVAVSMDGLNQYHDSNRFYISGKGCFNDVEKNLQKIIEKGINPNIMTVVSNENMDGLVELTEFLIEKNLPFRYSFIQGEDLNQEKLITTMNECYDILDKATENGYQFSRLHKLCDLKFLNPFFQTCSAGYSGGAIYLDGGMYFCHVNFGEDKNNGNISENTDLFELINKGKDNLTDLSEDCKNCNYQYICTGGCPIEREDGKDPHCDIYKVLIPRVYKIMGKERLLKVLQSNNNEL